MSINNCNLIGNVGNEPTLSYSAKGIAIVSLNLAVKRRFKKEETDWIKVIAFKQLAELIAQYVKKGSKIAVQGSIQTGNYTNKEGQKVYTFEVVADNVQFLDAKPQQDKPKQESKSNDPFEDGPVIDISDGDLPFE